MESNQQSEAKPPPNPVPNINAPLLVQYDGTLDEKLAKLAENLIQAMRDIKAEGVNGWAEISDALNHVDDDRIGSCKEDIDTLLVFAGLFSAVLTAFVVESYQRLSPDPSDQIIQLLTQIAAYTSGHTVASPYISSAAGSPTLDVFEPCAVDVQVNRLWFISLVLSLITASFGILIKQWLREYKSVDPQFTNLRSRLRIRQFRYPGLLNWKVFELAAVLPLIMQLALGLFLLGLCLFTSSINASVGRASTVLVSAWIFFFFAAAFAPATSSHCPYKISLLSSVYSRLRLLLSSRFSLQWLYVGPVSAVSRAQDYSALDRVIVKRLAWMLSYIPWGITKALAYLSRFGPGFLPSLQTRPPPSVPGRRETIHLRKPEEEKDKATDETEDLSMLSAVDDILLDDELLETKMRRVVLRGQFTPERTVAFLREVVERRLPESDQIHGAEEEPLPVFDHRGFSVRAWGAISEIAWTTYREHALSAPIGSIGINQEPGKESSSSWIDAMVPILASEVIPQDNRVSDLPDPSALYPQHQLHYPIIRILPGVWSGKAFRDIWQHLKLFLPQRAFEDPTLILRIHQGQYCQAPCQHNSALSQARSHCPSLQDQSEMYLIVMDLLDKHISNEYYVESDFVEALCAALSWTTCTCHIDPSQDSPRNVFTRRLFRHILKEESNILEELLKTCQSEFTWFLSRPVGLPFILRDADANGRKSILDLFIFALSQCDHIEAWHNGEDPAFLPFAYHNRVVEMYIETITEIEQNSEEWTVLLHLLARMIRSSHHLNESQLVTDWIKPSLRFCEAQIFLSQHSFLQPHWNAVVEALRYRQNNELDITRSDVYRNPITRSDSSDMFSLTAQSSIISSSSIIPPSDATAHTQTPDMLDTIHFEARLREILKRFKFDASRDTESGHRDNTSGSTYSVNMIPESLLGCALKVISSFLPTVFRRKADYAAVSNSDSGLVTESTQAQLMVPSHQARTCAQGVTMSADYYSSLLWR